MDWWQIVLMVIVSAAASLLIAPMILGYALMVEYTSMLRRQITRGVKWAVVVIAVSVGMSLLAE